MQRKFENVPPLTEPFGGELPLPKTGKEVGPWQKFLIEFQEFLTVAGHTEKTRQGYDAQTRRFVGWLLSRGCVSPAAITPDLCLAYQRAVFYHKTPRGRPNPVTSQVGMLTVMRVFTKFLKRKGYVLVDSGHSVQLPRLPKRLPRDILTEEEITKVLSLPDVATMRGFRDRTVLELLYTTGMRSGELVNLNVEDVNLEQGHIHIRQGKGRKDRVVPVGDIAAEFVAGYIKVIRPRLLRKFEQRALLIGWSGRKYSTAQGLLKEFRRYLIKAGITKNIVFHSIRHTCATHMLRSGAGIRYIQELLGHETVATTERYAKVEIGDLQQVHEKYHPRKLL